MVIPEIELRETFIELTVAVTGFDRSTILGTGLVEQHLRDCRRLAGVETVNTLLASWDRNDPYRFEPNEVPTVNHIVGVWYLGKWMPTNEVLSPEAYREALAWNVIHTHPPGAKQPGFASWTEAPE